jgi:pimeloyl-ACP methyl ester carboxylesterase
MAAQGAAIGTWGKIPEKERYASLKTIQQPTLVVNGKHDLLVPTINSYILQQQLPNATLIIYPDSGHGAIFQFSELFVREALFFLNS